MVWRVNTKILERKINWKKICILHTYHTSINIIINIIFVFYPGLATRSDIDIG